MYLGIDIGGTKTLATVLDDGGKLIEQEKFPTPKNYNEFLKEISRSVAALTTKNFAGAVIGVPGLIDREAGIVFALGNLPWRNSPIKGDIATILGGTPVTIENDARLAGLSEAQLVKADYKEVLFLTVSTGIGGALIKDGEIVAPLRDTEMGKMPLIFNGQLTNWEDFAGGRGVVNHFHKMASEITDPAAWQEIGENIAYGLAAVCSVLQPEVIILGGPVGSHANKYSDVITDYLDQHLHPVVRRPKAILMARRPDEAVIYGCYELARQVYGQIT